MIIILKALTVIGKFIYIHFQEEKLKAWELLLDIPALHTESSRIASKQFCGQMESNQQSAIDEVGYDFAK
jgi:hypothetical protein